MKPEDTTDHAKAQEEKKEAIQVLGDRSLLFDKNEVFEDGKNAQGNGDSETKQNEVYVAIKKVKMNSFNVRCPFNCLILINRRKREFRLQH